VRSIKQNGYIAKNFRTHYKIISISIILWIV